MKIHYLRYVLISTIVVFLTACKSENEINNVNYPTPVKLFQINIENKDKNITLPATIKASEQSLLSFRVGGQINKMYVNSGDRVKRGTLLATIESSIYDQEVNLAKANYELALVVYNRAKLLVKKGFVSKSDYDTAKSELQTSKSALEKAQNNRNYTRLVSPFDGVVITKYSEAYEFAREKEVVVGIQAESMFDISFQLPEQFISLISQKSGSVTPNTKVNVQFEGSERFYDASIKEINTVADQATASYTVVASITKPDEINLLPGMTAKVKLSISKSKNYRKSKIPVSALINENGQTYIFRWEPEVNKLTKVAIKIEDNQLVDGLSDGDWVVEVGVSELRDGQTAVQWIKERGL
ncbi:efflux transporter periplasmic adaptor subunit [Photobacterium rosenbergii]|uniref:Efflux transporter periplasmic adaptor subunit n=1 Tax=Photobacterium rosenbergii TaxID=294936 RepID=A0A2T3NKC2_9GAMM|nr:efflux RND transporter periplasmic adaptor subunit [Photobacterium rosenbergii]PSW15892.1 efflux transporter periplasmic adaptor subunit [Photobacterium rosenbergii]